MLQDFWSASDYFTTLRSKGLYTKSFCSLVLSIHNKDPVYRPAEKHANSDIYTLCEIINGFHLLTIFAKSYITDAWHGSEYASIVLATGKYQ